VKNRNAADLLCLIAQPLLLNAISIPAMAFIIRSLGAARYGEWMTACAIVATTGFVANLGLRTLFVRRIAQEPENVASALAEQLGLRLVLAIVAGALALLLCLAMRYSSLVSVCVFVAAIGLGITVLAGALADVLQGFQRFQAFALTNLAAGIVLTLASVIAAWYGAGPLELSLVYLIGPTASLLLLFLVVNRHICHVRLRWNIARFGTLLGEVRVLGLQQFLSTLQERIEQLLVPRLLGMAAFGYFSAGVIPASRLAIIPDGMATAYYPKIAWSRQSDDSDMQPLVVQLLLLSLIACIPVAILLAFLAGPIAHILFSKNAALCRDILRITIWSVPLQGTLLPMVYALQAAGQHADAARRGMWATALGCGISILLVSRFGIIGACVSWCVRPALGILFLLPRFIREFPAVIPRLPAGRICGCALLMLAVLWAAANAPIPGTVVSCVGCGLSILLYSAALVGFGVIKSAQLRKLLGR
jgi:O-antigen/teichoic acid export membrane protein